MPINVPERPSIPRKETVPVIPSKPREKQSPRFLKGLRTWWNKGKDKPGKAMKDVAEGRIDPADVKVSREGHRFHLKEWVVRQKETNEVRDKYTHVGRKGRKFIRNNQSDFKRAYQESVKAKKSELGLPETAVLDKKISNQVVLEALNKTYRQVEEQKVQQKEKADRQKEKADEERLQRQKKIEGTDAYRQVVESERAIIHGKGREVSERQEKRIARQALAAGERALQVQEDQQRIQDIIASGNEKDITLLNAKLEEALNNLDSSIDLTPDRMNFVNQDALAAYDEEQEAKTIAKQQEDTEGNEQQKEQIRKAKEGPYGYTESRTKYILEIPPQDRSDSKQIQRAEQRALTDALLRQAQLQTTPENFSNLSDTQQQNIIRTQVRTLTKKVFNSLSDVEKNNIKGIAERVQIPTDEKEKASWLKFLALLGISVTQKTTEDITSS